MSVAEKGPGARASQLSAHGAERVELPGPYGPIAALRTTRPADAIALLVPGYTGSKEDFAPLLDGCATAGFEAVAVDLPGQYESPGPDDEDAYLPAALGDVIAELVRLLALDGRPVLVLGHSYGGLVVRRAVLAGAPVAGLTLLDSGPGSLTDPRRLKALEIGDQLLRVMGIAAAYQLREQFNAHYPGWSQASSELHDFFRKRFVVSAVAGLLGMAHGLRNEPDLVSELAATLRRGGAPCAVVAGQFDDAWSVPEQEDMARRMDASFSLVAGAAHSPNTENPAGLLAALLPTWRTWLS